MNVHCVNPECPELDIPKSMFIALPDGQNIACGGCGEPVVDDTGTVVVGPIAASDPPDPGPTLEDRVAALEAFNTELVTALQAVFDPADPATASSLSDLVPKGT